MKPWFGDTVFNMTSVSVVCVLLLSLIGVFKGDLVSIYLFAGCVVVIVIYVWHTHELNKISKGRK